MPLRCKVVKFACWAVLSFAVMAGSAIVSRVTTPRIYVQTFYRELPSTDGNSHIKMVEIVGSSDIIIALFDVDGTPFIRTHTASTTDTFQTKQPLMYVVYLTQDGWV